MSDRLLCVQSSFIYIQQCAQNLLPCTDWVRSQGWSDALHNVWGSMRNLDYQSVKVRDFHQRLLFHAFEMFWYSSTLIIKHEMSTRNEFINV